MQYFGNLHKYNDREIDFMPRIINPEITDTCFHCGNQAHYITVQTKIKRCVEKITQCPGVIRKMKESRKANGVDIKEHMKKMSAAGNKKLKLLHDDPAWVKQKGDKISAKVKERGGHSGNNNPMFEKTHSLKSRSKMSESAAIRDNTNIGKYVRTDEHRDAQSERTIELIKSGKFIKSSRTKPELSMMEILSDIGIDYISQYLIQYGNNIDVKRFRHLYDFCIPSLNILIEVDGDYWHSREDVKLRDRICEEVASNKLFDLYRFTETEINQSPAIVKQRIIDILQDTRIRHLR